MEKLLRDVFVNVLANLIAAAILYLLATGAGALPRNDNLQLTAATAVVSSFAGLALSYWSRKIGRQRLALVSVCIPGGVYIVLEALVFPDSAQPWWLAVNNAVGGGVFVLVGLIFALRYDQSGRHRRRGTSSPNSTTELAQPGPSGTYLAQDAEGPGEPGPDLR